jgi:hypothetical protein
LIFLRVLEDDPRTLYYFSTVFPVPEISDQEDRLAANRGLRPPHETAVAYMCSFCLWALDSTVRSATWIRAATDDVAQWPIPYDQMTLPAISRTPYLPPRRDDDDDGGHASGSSNTEGQQARSKSRLSQSRTPSTTTSAAAGKPSADHQGYVATIRSYTIRYPVLPYCTTGCLVGLCRGLSLDDKCPNVYLHRQAAAAVSSKREQQQQQDRHALTVDELRSRLVRQLDDNLEVDCECLDKKGYFGRYGVLFKITLTGYGYTFVAKGVQAAHRHDLAGEEAVYEHLRAFQGRLVPVFMGVIDLIYPFPLRSLAKVSHMMLLSWAGQDLKRLEPRPEGVDLEGEVLRTEFELQAAGLWNDDVRYENMTWNAESRRVMQIDFDQADILQPSLVSAAEGVSKAPPSPPLAPPPSLPDHLASPLLPEGKRVLEESSLDGRDAKRPRANKDRTETSILGTEP